MFSFIEIAAFIILCVAVAKLYGRVSALEKRVDGSQNVMPQPAVPSAPPEAIPLMADGMPRVKPVIESAPIAAGPIEPTAGERFSAWLKEDWLLKLGAFIVLLGFGWLTTYAFMNNWIGPMGRITLGIFAGAALMGFGFYWMRKYIAQGGVFLVLGSATVILTIFAARSYYDFFTPFTALLVMFLCAAFVALASVRYRTRNLALISLILAGLTPLMIGGESNAIALFVYLFVVSLGTIWVVALTGWRVLVFAALVVVSLYSIPYWTDGFMGSNNGMLVMIAYAFAALFFITGALGVLKSQGKDRSADLLVAGGNGIFLLLWILSGVSSEWQSLVIAAWMVVFAAGGFAVFRVTRQAAPFLLYAGVATAFLAAATAVELDGAALILTYAFEAGIIPILLYFLVQHVELAERASLLLIAPVLMSVPHVISSIGWYHNGSFGEDFSVLLCMALILLFVGMFFRYHKAESPTPLTLYPAMIVAGLVYVYILIWGTLHQTIYVQDVATIIALVIYTLIGLATYFYGRSHKVREIKLHGSILLAFVVGRLLLVDVWAMEMGGRIITFFLVGALLMTTAFVGRGKKEGQ